MESIRVVVADDHAGLRAAIRGILESTRDIQVVGEAKDGMDALKQVSELGPDVLVLDMQMSKLDATGVIKNLAEQNPAIKVLVLSSYNEPFYIKGVLEYGAAGYLSKDEGPQMIVEAVRKVAKGERGLFSQKAKGVLREIESAENSR